jgi:predicted ATPase
VLQTLAIENYRSLRMLVLPLTSLTIVTGGNGTGKSSLYRALRLLADGARNGMVAALAREGGLPSIMWAGPEHIGRAVREGRHPVQGTVRSGSVALRLGFGAKDVSYAVESRAAATQPDGLRRRSGDQAGERLVRAGTTACGGPLRSAGRVRPHPG